MTPPPGFPALDVLPEVTAVAAPPMDLCPTPLPDPEETATVVPGIDDPFVLILYNMHLMICAQEEKNAEMKRRKEQLITEVLREEKAVERAERWIQLNEDHLPELERILLVEEQTLDQCTVSLMAVTDETEERPPEEDEVLKEGQRLQFTLECLRSKVEHPEEVEEEDVLGLIQGYEETYGSLQPVEVLEEEVARLGDQKKKRRRDKKKKCGCFSGLWRRLRR